MQRRNYETDHIQDRLQPIRQTTQSESQIFRLLSMYQCVFQSLPQSITDYQIKGWCKTAQRSSPQNTYAIIIHIVIYSLTKYYFIYRPHFTRLLYGSTDTTPVRKTYAQHPLVYLALQVLLNNYSSILTCPIHSLRHLHNSQTTTHIFVYSLPPSSHHQLRNNVRSISLSLPTGWSPVRPGTHLFRRVSNSKQRILDDQYRLLPNINF